MNEITFPAMGVETHFINGRLCIDSMDLIVHLSRYFNTVADAAETLQSASLAISAESTRNLALFLMEAHDLAVAENPEMFQKELDNLFRE